MKIEHKNKGKIVTNINEIAKGQVFIHDDEYYISSESHDDDGDIMCINLESGDSVAFSDSRESSYCIVNAKLVIGED